MCIRDSNERTDLHDGGRLQPSEPETSTAAGSDFGQIRSDEEKVSVFDSAVKAFSF